MYEAPQFEIPKAVRDVAGNNVAQVRQAYDGIAGLMRKAQDIALKSHGAMAESFMEIQARSLSFAQSNIEANFNFVAELARARDVNEYLEIQTRYTQTQLETYAKQAQELTRLLSETAHRAQPNG